MTNPNHFCVLCPDRERIPYRPPVCEACRPWLSWVVYDIGDHAALLAAPEDLVPDRRALGDPQLRRWAGLDRNEYGHDYINAQLPSGSSGNRAGAPVSGSRTPPIPIVPDKVDILGHARQGSRAPMARGILGIDNDQVGHLPLATTLEMWVRNWRAHRQRGERQPVGSIAAMCRWLRDRIDWACDEHPRIDEFAAEMRAYRSTMAGLLGLIDIPDRRDGVACPQCDSMTLYRKIGGPPDGTLWTECWTCPVILSPRAYAEWVEQSASYSHRTIVAYVALAMREQAKRPASIPDGTPMVELDA